MLSEPACHNHVGVMFYTWITSNMHVVSTDTCMYPSCYMKHVMSACYLLVGSPCMHAWCYNIILGYIKCNIKYLAGSSLQVFLFKIWKFRVSFTASPPKQQQQQQQNKQTNKHTFGVFYLENAHGVCFISSDHMLGTVQE